MMKYQPHYYEDLSVGLEFKTDLSGPVGQDTIDEYLDLTDDRFGIHSNPAFAKQFYNDVIVPGNLVVALSTGLVYGAGHFSETLFVQAAKNTRFVSPLYAERRIYVVEKITHLEDRVGKPYGKVVLERKTMALEGEEENEDSDTLILLTNQDYRVLKRPIPDRGSTTDASE